MRLVTDTALLRHVCAPVPEGEDVSQLAEEMSVVMYVDNGIGLAAPQVGVNKRLIVMDPTGEGTNSSLYIMINPLITFTSLIITRDVEGCLSLPRQQAEVPRYEWVSVKYRSLTGEVVDAHFKGLAARVVQHEIDHLDGKLMTDFGVGAR